MQPVLRQKLLNLNRLRVLAGFEKSRGSRAIALVHRQETMSLHGFPVMRFVDGQDSDGVQWAVRLAGHCFQLVACY